MLYAYSISMIIRLDRSRINFAGESARLLTAGEAERYAA
jgi:hypothetical protein